MGYRQVYTLNPISPWSPDPWNDAAKEISSATGLPLATVLASAVLVWYNDPYTSLGNGTGIWQWDVQYEFESETGIEKDLYVIRSGGNAFTSVGGGQAAPAPTFTGTPFASGNVFQKMSPLIMPNRSGLSGPTSAAGSGGASIIRHWIEPSNPSSLLADILNVVNTTGQTAVVVRYYYDPQTVAGAGRGIWRVKCFSWGPNYVALTVVESGGCTLNMAGGPPGNPIPPSWGGYTRVNSISQML